jgi:hypothetical protein
MFLIQDIKSMERTNVPKLSDILEFDRVEVCKLIQL